MNLSDPLSAVLPTLDGQVLRVLAKTTGRLTAPTIARLVRRGSEPGVRLALERLTGTGTVVAERVGRQSEYRANTAHAAWEAIAAALAFSDTFHARLDARILDTLGPTARDMQATCAVFGSLVDGTAGPDSDIDLLLIVPDDDLVQGQELSEQLTDRVELFTGNAVNVMLLTRSMQADLVSRDDPLVESWRTRSRTLLGSDPSVVA